ncbi:MAG: helix-turn-helix domain-containing protein [Cytophagales bacterium]
MKKIPVYGLETFTSAATSNFRFKVEPFDHKRHYKVEYPHRHDYFYEVLYIKQGSGTYVIDFQNFEIKPETIFFVSPGQVHEIHYSEDIFGYIFLFTEEFLSISSDDNYGVLFNEIQNKKEAICLTTNELSAKFEFIFKEAILNFEWFDKFSESICCDFLKIILRLSVRESVKENPVFYQQTKGAEIVKKFKALINKKYTEYLSVKDYAELLAITSSHLNETVKELTGINANALIDNKLLVEIKRLLAYTEQDITEIAYQFNFKDQSYFSRFFKTKTGVSPKEFRANSIKNT